MTARAAVLSLVDARLAVLEDYWKFGTLPGSMPSGSSPLKTKINTFNANHPAFHSAVHSAMGQVQDNHKQILAHAVNAALYHVGGLDYPTETASAIHHEVMNLGTNLTVASGMAHQMMSHAVTKLKAWRAGRTSSTISPHHMVLAPQECQEDERIDELLDRLEKILKELEPRYRDSQ